jgi:hypothetical protein
MWAWQSTFKQKLQVVRGSAPQATRWAAQTKRPGTQSRQLAGEGSTFTSQAEGGGMASGVVERTGTGRMGGSAGAKPRPGERGLGGRGLDGPGLGEGGHDEQRLGEPTLGEQGVYMRACVWCGVYVCVPVRVCAYVCVCVDVCMRVCVFAGTVGKDLAGTDSASRDSGRVDPAGTGSTGAGPVGTDPMATDAAGMGQSVCKGLTGGDPTGTGTECTGRMAVRRGS